MSNKITVYHGSPKIIEKPVFGAGNPQNDYGLGFYCTESVELAKEWACSVETDGFAFIAVGRPESAGCYCKINTYLKEVISILSADFDFVVIDGEAGVEQINRRVMEKVTHLLLVTDASKKGTQVIQTIKSVADDLVMYKKLGAIVNRIPDESVIDYINTGGIPVLSYIPTDSNLAIFDIEGKDITKLPDDSNVVEGARKALKELDIL